MDKNSAIIANLKLNREAFSLTPSAIITLFQIDVSDIAFDAGIVNANEFSTKDYVFRFHNNTKLTNNVIYWKGEEYIPAPIKAEGFEMTSRGTLPVPRLSITSNEDGITQLSLLKQKINEIGDLIGAKVTRIRTFAKYIDAINFTNEIPPNGFDPSPDVAFPEDIFYVERKSSENKSYIEYELSSILDVEGIKLPGRIVLNSRCPWTYRGEGCLYEYSERRVDEIHGTSDKSTLFTEAPAVMTVNDEEIETVINGTKIVDKGEFQYGRIYAKGAQVYIQKNGIKFYFVARFANPQQPPPNPSYWVADNCSKSVSACRARMDTRNNGRLNFGGFAGTNKYS